jgi:hypothetical protein
MFSRIFVPQAQLDAAVLDGRVDLRGQSLVIAELGTLACEESALILREVTTGECPKQMLGKVRARHELLGEGAELLEDSMVLGDNAYDIVSGFTLTPNEEHAPQMREALPKVFGADVG